MISTSKINNISNIYQQHRINSGGAPPSRDDKIESVLPVDRVSLSKNALENADQGIDKGLSAGERDLTNDEQQVVRDLKQRDAEVKAHEAAHIAAGSGVVSGGATYQYQTGPDGKMYAVGGEVSIDLSSEGSPDATIRKMQQVKAAALAPAQPSGTDRAVAAQAAQIEAMARLEKSEKLKEEAESSAVEAPSGVDPAEESQSPAEQPGSLIDLMA